MGRHWLGIDLGTSSIKALVLNDRGGVVDRGRAPLDVGGDGVTTATHDPVLYREALRAAVVPLTRKRQIDAVGLSGNTPSLVLVDEAGMPQSPVILWRDTRAARQAEALGARFGDPMPLVGTHLPWSPANLPAKLAWLVETMGDDFLRGRWLLQPKDLVGCWLTGDVASDPWSSKGLCHVGNATPVAELFVELGAPVEMTPPIKPGWAQLGRACTEFAGQLGLGKDTVVSVGWSDALAAMLTAGVFESPVGFVLSGSSDIVGVSVDESTSRTEPLFLVPHGDCAPLDVVYGPTQTSGAALDWATLTLGLPLAALSATGPLEDATPVFLPYLAGERAPIWDSSLSAAFFGLNLAHRSVDLLHAVAAGVACSNRHVLDTAAHAVGAMPERVVVVDSADDTAMARLRATVLERPVTRCAEPMASAYGAALLGAAAGLGGLEHVSGLRPTTETVEPETGGAAYFERYRRYVDQLLGRL